MDGIGADESLDGSSANRQENKINDNLYLDNSTKDVDGVNEIDYDRMSQTNQAFIPTYRRI